MIVGAVPVPVRSVERLAEVERLEGACDELGSGLVPRLVAGPVAGLGTALGSDQGIPDAHEEDTDAGDPVEDDMAAAAGDVVGSAFARLVICWGGIVSNVEAFDHPSTGKSYRREEECRSTTGA